MRSVNTESDGFARRLLTAIFADAVDLKIVAGGIKPVLASNLLFQLTHFRREEFDGSAALSTNHVVVAAAVELMFVARGAIGKRDSAGQTAFGQQFERPIDRGKADLAVALLHQAEQFVSGKMIAGVEERAQDGVALLGMLESHAPQVLVKDVLGLAHGFARGRSVVVNASLQHGRQTLKHPC